MSQDGTYEIPGKTSITNDTWQAQLAGSDAIVRNHAGTCAEDWHKSDTAGSEIVHDSAMKNPDGACQHVGTEFGISFKTETYRNRAGAATALGMAIAECHPFDACVLMEAALDSLTEGHPYYPLCRTMSEAGYWADQATRNERKAFALANYTRLSTADQAAFLAHVQHGGAA